MSLCDDALSTAQVTWCSVVSMNIMLVFSVRRGEVVQNVRGRMSACKGVSLLMCTACWFIV